MRYRVAVLIPTYECIPYVRAYKRVPGIGSAENVSRVLVLEKNYYRVLFIERAICRKRVLLNAPGGI